ncbi:MAG: IS1634 family transposase, partial [Mycobacterium sp.]
MASIVGKRRGKQTYYYLVESARVGGKPRIVSQQYLGSADEVIAKLSETGAGRPQRSAHKRFGDLAAVWSMLQRLDVAGIVDEVVPRYANAAATVGTYMALACANRIVDPCSKRGFADWWETTAGPRLVKLDRAAVDHRRFWDAMDRLGEVQLREIETRLSRRMVTEFGLDLSGLALDMTNFATFIDTGNDKAPIAQRGKAKQKRTDLRLVGLALVITRDGGVPVISHAYPGDRPDVTQFSTVIDELVARYRGLFAGVESLTVVYDAGQNSGDNHAIVEAHGIGFVGSLPPSDHPGLLAIPGRDHRSVDEDRYPGLTFVDTTVTALGVTRRAVLTHSANLHAKQARGLDQTLAKARRRLAELAARLARGHTRRNRATVEAEIAAICKPRWVTDIITITLTGERPADLRLAWRTDTRAHARLEARLFGKRILFTNRDWP